MDDNDPTIGDILFFLAGIGLGLLMLQMMGIFP